MCDFVGVKLSDIDTTKDGWYHMHSWTEAQEDEFGKWLENYLWENKNVVRELTKRRYINKKQIHQLTQEILLLWGWKTVINENKSYEDLRQKTKADA